MLQNFTTTCLPLEKTILFSIMLVCEVGKAYTGDLWGGVTTDFCRSLFVKILEIG